MSKTTFTYRQLEEFFEAHFYACPMCHGVTIGPLTLGAPRAKCSKCPWEVNLLKEMEPQR